MARVTGLEPATSGVTGRHSNRLSYTRALPAATRRCVGERWIKGFDVECQACQTRFPTSLSRFFEMSAKPHEAHLAALRFILAVAVGTA